MHLLQKTSVCLIEEKMIRENMKEVPFYSVVFPYKNIENNQKKTLLWRNVQNHSNRKRVAYDVRFFMVNMKGVCCTCLQCTYFCSMHMLQKLRSYKDFKRAPTKWLSCVWIHLDYPLVIRPSADSKNQRTFPCFPGTHKAVTSRGCRLF